MKPLSNTICLLALLTASSVVAAASPQHPVSAKRTKTTMVNHGAKYPLPHLGVYRWGSTKGVAQADAFAAWIGRPDIWGEEFEPSDQWGNVTDPTSWLFQPWEGFVAEHPGRQLVLTVPLLVGGWDGSGPTTGPGAGKPVSLKQGAAGDYNAYYTELAKNLVLYHLGSCIIRLGHEFNGGWYTWRAAGDPADYAAYWRQVVTTMHAVPGASKLQFCWNPAVGYQQFPAETAYPGDAYVDYIGLDVYDQSWDNDTYPIPANDTPSDIALRRTAAWNGIAFGNHGIAFWQTFAEQHKKPFCIPEWGATSRTDGHGGGDNPGFISNMHTWMTTHPVAWDVYFDVNAGDGEHQLSPGAGQETPPPFPLAAARFRQLFGGKSVTAKTKIAKRQQVAR